MLRQLARYLVKLYKDILKIYYTTTLYEKWNDVSGEKLVASFIWCKIVYCKIFRSYLHMKCNIHEFYILLLASLATLLCTANATMQSFLYIAISHIVGYLHNRYLHNGYLHNGYPTMDICTMDIPTTDKKIIQDTQCYCFASHTIQQNITVFLSNTVEFQNFQGQLWQKTISHWIWNFHVKIWRISKWMFCI